MINPLPIPDELWVKVTPDAQAAIAALFLAMQQRVNALETRVRDLEARLKLHSTNSSKPPSSDPIGLKRKPPAPSTGRKRDGQPGHHKATRALVPPETAAEVLTCKPEACRRCQQPLVGADPEPLIHPVAELPPADADHQRDWWDHGARAPEPRLVRAVVPQARGATRGAEGVTAVKDRRAGQPPELRTSATDPADETVIEPAFRQPVVAPREPARPGRRRDPAVTSATVRQEREKNRVAAVPRTVVLGSPQAVDQALKPSLWSRAITTSFGERQSRRTDRFSKDGAVPEAMTDVTRYRYNSCGPVRTVRVRSAAGRWQRRTPAMAAG